MSECSPTAAELHIWSPLTTFRRHCGFDQLGTLSHASQYANKIPVVIDQNGTARLHGWVRTDENGHFEFRTIVPGAYPRLSIARHVHFHAYGGGYPLQWTEELKFAGDPLLKDGEIKGSSELGKFAYIQPLVQGPDGAHRCQIKLRLSTVTNYPPQYRDDVRTK
jgi:protocatechuate 3,4-dioxygenase beta subunit